jgi:ABC-type Mn2+/Zn2+ transport system permease subunit
MESLPHNFVQIFQDFIAYPFLQHTLLALLLVAIPCSWLSVFVVFKRMAFISMGISYSSFGGFALGLILFPSLLVPDWRVFTVAAVFCFLIAMLIAFISRTGFLPEDTAIGIFLVVGIALGMVLRSVEEEIRFSMPHYLFGSVETIVPVDLYVLGGMAGVVMVFMLLFFRDYFALCFDPRFARAIGLPTGFLHYSFILCLAAVVVVSVKMIGVVLVSAFLVLPGATARMLSRHMKTLLWLSIMIGILSVITGFIISNLYDSIPVTAIIIMVQFAFFLIALPYHRFFVSSAF